MHSLFFWKRWPKHERTLWWVLSSLFLFSFVFLWWYYFQDAHGIIAWEKLQEQKIVETTIHQFRLGPFELNIPAESYVIFEFLQGGNLHHNFLSSYGFLAVLIASAMVLLAVITTLPKFWYYAGMALFILFVASLRLEVLLLFGAHGYVAPLIVLMLFLALSFYFKSIRPATAFSMRLAALLSAAVTCGIIIHFFAGIPYPMLHLVATAYLPALILTVLFIVMVAHEILASFIFIASQGRSKSLQHFFVISLIYMFNIFITCLHEMGVIQWQFMYVNLYLLLCASALLGLWGFRQKEPLYESIFSFRPLGAFFYVALGTICLITISQLLGNANDAALKIVRDVIIFSHAGYGLIFLTYVISNFMVMMADNLPVYKLLYKPNRMPFFTFRLAGLIATLAFVFYSNWHQYVYHGLAGFYNYVADLYMLQGNEALGQAFYDESSKYAFQSHRANYALAAIKSARFNFKDAHYNYELANGRRPSEFSLVNAGDLYAWEKKYFPAIKAYREGKKTMPSSPVLANNLGFAYAKVHSLDSAAYYINEARENPLTKNSAEANFLAMAAMEYLPVHADSVLAIFQSTSPMVTGNALALATLFGQRMDIHVDPFPDKPLDLYTATLLNNYCIYRVESLDTAVLDRAYATASDSLNYPYSEALKATLAHAFYSQGNVAKALEVLAELAYINPDYRGKYNYIMGLWALEQGNPGIASSYFMHAETADYKDAEFYNAISLTEAGNVNLALTAWDSIAKKPDPNKAEIAVRMRRILSASLSQAMQLNDAEKYQFCRYKIKLADTTSFNNLANTFQRPDYKAQALLDRTRKHFNAGDVTTAIRYLNRINGLELTDKELYHDVRYMELRMLAWRRELPLLAKQINKGVEFGDGHELEKMLYTALMNEASGDKGRARRYYSIVGTWNPYFEEGIIAAADFFRREGEDKMKPYNILVEAIQINNNSYRLLKAYAEEAERMGFDEYAASARQRMQDIRSSLR
jgi:Flp pilus assembly protein TadD